MLRIITIIILLISVCRLAEIPSFPLFSLCDRGEVLRQVDELLVDETVETHYMIINKEWVLSIWLVDSELDPLASSGEAITENSQLAFQRGATVAHQIADQIPCTREVFDGINPMIVDQNYNGWYIDIIPMHALPITKNPTNEVLLASIERSGMEYADLRRISPQEHAPMTESCFWSDARPAIEEIIDSAQPNQAAYLIISPDETLVQIQWEITPDEEEDDQAIVKRLGHLSKLLDCLDTLELFIVDDVGRLKVYGRVSGETLRHWETIPAPEKKIWLHRIPDWLIYTGF